MFKLARVTSIVLDKFHEKYDGEGSIGSITYNLIDEPVNIKSNQLVKPLNANISHYPLPNEIVYLVSAPHPDYNVNNALIDYYLAPHAIHTDRNMNALASTVDQAGRYETGKYFREIETILPLKPHEGDIIFEGRFGNSIRFGATTTQEKRNLNPWSVEGMPGDPITIIRNGQSIRPDTPNYMHVLEDINTDASSIYLCTNQKIPMFKPSSLHNKSYGGEPNKNNSNPFGGPSLTEPEHSSCNLPQGNVEETVTLNQASNILPKDQQIQDELSDFKDTDTSYYDISPTENQSISPYDDPRLLPSSYVIPDIIDEAFLIADMSINTDIPFYGNTFARGHNIKSKQAETLNIDNYPGVDSLEDTNLTANKIWANLALVHSNCINPIIEAFGHDNIKITSAYRSSELNRAIGGNPRSQHISGHAVDIVSKSHPSSLLWNWCFQNLPQWYQLIWEYPERGDFNSLTQPFSWVHISFIDGNNPKTTSFSSKKKNLHEMYQGELTTNIGDYTHGITLADQNLL